MGKSVRDPLQARLQQLDMVRSSETWYEVPQVWNLVGNPTNQQWSPPGLGKFKPLKRSKMRQEATELLSNSWSVLPEDTQAKLQALGIGPSKPEEPELTDTLKTHMDRFNRSSPSSRRQNHVLSEKLPQSSRAK